MDTFDIWKILAIITPILLMIYWGKRNAVWGGFTIGIVGGLIVAIFSEFDLYTIGKGAVLGAMVGFAAEMLGRISGLIKKGKL